MMLRRGKFRKTYSEITEYFSSGNKFVIQLNGSFIFFQKTIMFIQ